MFAAICSIFDEIFGCADFAATLDGVGDNKQPVARAPKLSGGVGHFRARRPLANATRFLIVVLRVCSRATASRRKLQRPKKRSARAAYENAASRRRKNKQVFAYVRRYARKFVRKMADVFARLKAEKRQKATYNRRRNEKWAFERHREWQRLGALRVCSHRLAAAAATRLLLLLHRRRVRRLLQVEKRVASRRPPLRVLSGSLTCHEIVNRALLRRNAKRRLAERFMLHDSTEVFVATIAKRSQTVDCRQFESAARRRRFRHPSARVAVGRFAAAAAAAAGCCSIGRRSPRRATIARRIAALRRRASWQKEVARVS